MAGLQVAFYEMTPGKFDFASILPAQIELSWPELTTILTSAASAPCTAADCVGKKCPHKMRSGEEGAWSPVVLDGTRSNDNVQALTALVLDGDGLSGEQLAVVAARARGFSFIIHTTHRHRPSAIFVRLIIQLSRPVLPAEWPLFYPRAISHLALDGVFDPTCKDLSRLYYLPTHPSDVPFLADSGEGQALDVDAVLAASLAVVPAAPVDEYVPEHDAAKTDYTDLGTIVAQLGVYRRSRSHGTAEEKDRAALIGRLLAGEPLAAPGGNADPPPKAPAADLPEGRGYAIMRAARICTTYLPIDVPDEAYFEIFRRSIDAMCFGRLADRAEMEAQLLEKLRLGREKRKEFDAEAQARNTAAKTLQVALVEERTKQREEERRRSEAASRLPPGTVEWTPIEPPVEDSSWMMNLQMRKDDGGLIAAGINAYLILKHAGDLRGVFRWNDVSLEIEGFGLFKDEEPETFDVAASNYLAQKWGLSLRPNEVYRQILKVAYEWRFDPIRDYLRSLKWDGLDRINEGDGWLATYAGAFVEPEWDGYVRKVGCKWLVSAAARAVQPGCKVDTVLILKGAQGKRKSTMLEALGGPFYADVALALADKDAKMLAARSWISELPDLAALKRASEQNAIKAFFSTAEDTFRPPYARTQIKSPRRNVFAGTTNDDEFLIDWTGNRRYWPVKCDGEIDLAAVIRDRDQLWAQAVVLYDKHVRECANKLECCCWWFSGREAEFVEKIATQYVYESEHAIAILEWWDGMAPDKRPKTVTTNQVAKDALKYTQDRVTRGTLMAIGPALTKLGFKKTRRAEGSMYVSVFTPSEELLARPQVEQSKSGFKVFQGGKQG